MKWERMAIGRNSPKSGYYILLIIATSDVHDHHSDREVSTASSSQPTLDMEHDWRTSPGSTVSQDSGYPLSFKKTCSQAVILIPRSGSVQRII